jgi:hypothetical protein
LSVVTRIFDQNRDAVQCTAHLAAPAFAIKGVGNLQRARIDLNHRVEPRPGIVDGGDAIEVGLCQRDVSAPLVSRSRISVALSSTTSIAGGTLTTTSQRRALVTVTAL